MKRVTYFFEESQIARLQAQSDVSGVPASHMVRLAVEHFLKVAESEENAKQKRSQAKESH